MNSNAFQIKLSYQVNETALEDEQVDIEDVAEHIQRQIEDQVNTDEFSTVVNTTGEVVTYVVGACSPIIDLEARLMLDDIGSRANVETFVDRCLRRLPNINKQYCWDDFYSNDRVEHIDDILLISDEVVAVD